MLDPIVMFKDGGPFMYVILMGGLCMPLFVAAAGVLAATRLRVPAALHLLIGTSVLLLGAVGTLQGLTMLDRALANCSPEMYATLAAAGQFVALFPLIAGGLIAALTLAGMGAAVGLGTAVRVKDRRLTVLHAVAAIPVFLAAAGFVVAGSVSGVVIALLGTAAIALVAVFASTDDDENGRLATVRATVGGLVTLALCSQAIQLVAITGAPWYQAKAHASAEMRGQLLALTADALGPAIGASVAAMLAGLLATALLVAPLFKGLLGGRAAIGTVAAGLALVPGALLLGYTGLRLFETHQETISAAEVRHAALAELGVELPTLKTDTVRRGILPRPTLTFLADGTVLLDGEETSPGPLPALVQEAGLNIEASPYTPLSAVLAHEPDSAREVHWVVQGPDDPMSLKTLKIRPEGDSSDGFVEIVANGIVVVVEGDVAQVGLAQRGEIGPAVEGPWSEVPAIIANIRVQYPDEQDVYLWLPADRTAQDLVGFVDTLIDQADDTGRDPAWVHWRTDPPPELSVLDEDDPHGSTDDSDAADPSLRIVRGGEVVTPATPTTSLGEASVLGSLDPDIVKRVVRRYSGQMKYCYESELAKHPELAGKIVVKFVISAEGTVSAASADSDSIGNPSLTECVLAKVKRWTFPKPPGGGIVIVKYPFVFDTP